jgi:hypothetical protein
MGTVQFSERTKQFLAVGLILLFQLVFLPRTFPIFFDSDAFYYFAYPINTLQDFKQSLLAPDAATQYRPLGQILFSFVFHPILKLNHTLYAVVALGFHMFNTVLVFFILRRLLKATVAIITATIFWGVNPVSIYITHSFAFLADFTFVFFYLTATFFFLKFIDTGRTIFAIAVFLGFIFSLGSKEAAVTLPPVLVFITIAFLTDDFDSSVLKDKSKWLFYLLFACLAAYLVMFYWIKGGKFYDASVEENYYFNFTIQSLLEKL